MELNKNKVFRITGRVQHYAWGGDFYLPSLLQITAKPGEHYAEYWLGAHKQGAAQLWLDAQQSITLSEYIRSFPEQTLGAGVQQRFGGMPYLLKILDVRGMLSIQVHPSKENAVAAFARENASGLAIDAATRNYKDENHKPELMLALSEFWLLHGFKPAAALAAILEEVPALHPLRASFNGNNYRLLYQTIMEKDQASVNVMLRPLLDEIIPLYEAGELPKHSEHFWAARAAITYNVGDDIDRGIFSIYLFNLLQVQPGQSLFQDAGLPHAYLEGQNVEIMANSDNVLRGGLTPKHVDVQELLRHIRFEPTDPAFITEKTITEGVVVFPTPAPDFELGRILLAAGATLRLSALSAEIFLLLKGQVKVTEHLENEFTRRKGEAWICFYQGIQYLTATEDSVLYRAAVPFQDNFAKGSSPV